MPAKWQQWMPFHIDRFKASPAVQAMHPAARIGYLYLLACSWQSEDCTLPADDDSLAELSGLGYELWDVHSARILKKFVAVNGRLRNPSCYEEWREAKRIYEARQEAAKKTNTVRSLDGHRAQTERSPVRSADTITLTVTNTETLNTNTKANTFTPSSAEADLANKKKKRSKKKSSLPTKTDIKDARHSLFKMAIWEYWKSKNSIDCPWGVPEGRCLDIWLSSCPNITLPQFTEMLRNRYRSNVNHSDRPSLWISRITSYANGPVHDRMALRNGGNNGKQQQSVLSQLIEENRSSVGPDGNHERLKTGSEYFDSLLEAVEEGA